MSEPPVKRAKVNNVGAMREPEKGGRAAVAEVEAPALTAGVVLRGALESAHKERQTRDAQNKKKKKDGVVKAVKDGTLVTLQILCPDSKQESGIMGTNYALSDGDHYWVCYGSHVGPSKHGIIVAVAAHEVLDRMRDPHVKEIYGPVPIVGHPTRVDFHPEVQKLRAPRAGSTEQVAAWGEEVTRTVPQNLLTLAAEMVCWRDLDHAYGCAVGTPKYLFGLLSPETMEESFGDLYASILHQGSIYSSTSYAIRVMAVFLREDVHLVGWPLRAEIANFLNNATQSISWEITASDMAFSMPWEEVTMPDESWLVAKRTMDAISDAIPALCKMLFYDGIPIVCSSNIVSLLSEVRQSILVAGTTRASAYQVELQSITFLCGLRCPHSPVSRMDASLARRILQEPREEWQYHCACITNAMTELLAEPPRAVALRQENENHSFAIKKKSETMTPAKQQLLYSVLKAVALDALAKCLPKDQAVDMCKKKILAGAKSADATPMLQAIVAAGTLCQLQVYEHRKITVKSSHDIPDLQTRLKPHRKKTLIALHYSC
eukprot:TRINITY_DN1041_c0_g1_i3.p1 TRINITY_DN1041_c0_g1~~TRINITY_DN1041_c0_g1_i3.p1  ORF type:complete len:547 (-),score=77.01 TRINITY_DN1041_c0_g1_i3:512-2152(-)